MMHFQKVYDYIAVLLRDGVMGTTFFFFSPALLTSNNNSPGIRPYLRKIALNLKMGKVIEQKGDQCIIKTCSIFRNYSISFRVGQDFEEFTEGQDNRHVKVTQQEPLPCGNSNVTCFIAPRGLQVLCVNSSSQSGLATVTGDMAGKQTGV